MNLDPNCENYIGRYGSANVEFASAPGSITTGAGRTAGGMMTLQRVNERLKRGSTSDYKCADAGEKAVGYHQ